MIDYVCTVYLVSTGRLELALVLSLAQLVSAPEKGLFPEGCQKGKTHCVNDIRNINLNTRQPKAKKYSVLDSARWTLEDGDKIVGTPPAERIRNAYAGYDLRSHGLTGWWRRCRGERWMLEVILDAEQEGGRWTLPERMLDFG